MSTQVGKGRMVFGEQHEVPCFYVLHISPGDVCPSIEGRVTLETNPPANDERPHLVLEDGRRVALHSRERLVAGRSVRVVLRDREKRT